MDTDLNHCTLTGTLERDPMTRFADHGKAAGQLHASAPRQWTLEEEPYGQALYPV